MIGGPDSGKTTLALLKCKGILDTLAPGQSILFLSFSRAAVQEILKRCREILTQEEMKRIDVRTYHSFCWDIHSFCWDILRCHGRLLGGRPLKMMAPSEEGTRRTQFEGDWGAESERLKDEDGIVCFDLFAAATAELFEGSTHLRSWMGRLFPLVILDEFQDSDDDQWRFVQQLSAVEQTLFLADTEQRIAASTATDVADDMIVVNANDYGRQRRDNMMRMHYFVTHPDVETDDEIRRIAKSGQPFYYMKDLFSYTSVAAPRAFAACYRLVAQYVLRANLDHVLWENYRIEAAA